MSKIYFENEEYIIKEYKTTLTNFYIKGIDNMYFQKKVRFLLNHLSGGGIYYLEEKHTGDIVGYCMISFGKSFHCNYANKDDITLGPIYLKQEHRGKRLSIILLSEVIKLHGNNKNAYAYIHRVNKQSNALFSRVGFVPVENVSIAKLSRKVSVTSQKDTDYILYRKVLNDELEI